MTDIDFDELDRAVSSLMDKQREKEAPVVAIVLMDEIGRASISTKTIARFLRLCS